MRKYLILPLGRRTGRCASQSTTRSTSRCRTSCASAWRKIFGTVLAPKGRIKNILDELFNVTAANTIDKTMDKTIDRLRDSLDKSLDRSMDKSAGPLDRQVDRHRGMGERRRCRPDPGADHQAGAGDDRRGRPQPRFGYSHRAHEGPRARALTHRRRVRRTRSHPAAHEGPPHLAMKIMAGIDIAEKRCRRTAHQAAGRQGDDRLPRQHAARPYHGESVVLRILRPTASASAFRTSGSRRKTTSLPEDHPRPNGIFLVTGPTGRGKTTTLTARSTS
jgi:hypothetical protein